MDVFKEMRTDPNKHLQGKKKTKTRFVGFFKNKNMRYKDFYRTAVKNVYI